MVLTSTDQYWLVLTARSQYWSVLVSTANIVSFRQFTWPEDMICSMHRFSELRKDIFWKIQLPQPILDSCTAPRTEIRQSTDRSVLGQYWSVLVSTWASTDQSFHKPLSWSEMLAPASIPTLHFIRNRFRMSLEWLCRHPASRLPFESSSWIQPYPIHSRNFELLSAFPGAPNQ